MGETPKGEIRIGISGWRYPAWRSVFYPPGLPQKKELTYASQTFRTVELNGSFYSLQRPESYRRWYDETPPGFIFAVKGGRAITHLKKLQYETSFPSLANFFASGVLRLEEKLGPILWQLPPQLRFERERLQRFFAILPRDTYEAARLGRGHVPYLEGRSYLSPKERFALRHAIEPRHESFADPKFVDLLRAHDIALVLADSAGKHPTFDEVTTDFVYVRLHGESYASQYDQAALSAWAQRLQKWQKTGRDVYVYFDNDAKVHAPFDALGLTALVEGKQVSREHPGAAGGKPIA